MSEERPVSVHDERLRAASQPAAAVEWTWGEETYPSREKTEEAIAAFCAQALCEADCGTVITQEGGILQGDSQPITIKAFVGEGAPPIALTHDPEIIPASAMYWLRHAQDRSRSQEDRRFCYVEVVNHLINHIYGRAAVGKHLLEAIKGVTELLDGDDVNSTHIRESDEAEALRAAAENFKVKP